MNGGIFAGISVLCIVGAGGMAAQAWDFYRAERKLWATWKRLGQKPDREWQSGSWGLIALGLVCVVALVGAAAFFLALAVNP